MAALSALSGFAFTPKGFTHAEFRERVGVLYEAGTKSHRSDDVSDRLHHAWKACENAFEHIVQEAEIAA